MTARVKEGSKALLNRVYRKLCRVDDAIGKHLTGVAADKMCDVVARNNEARLLEVNRMLALNVRRLIDDKENLQRQNVAHWERRRKLLMDLIRVTKERNAYRDAPMMTFVPQPPHHPV